MIIDDGELTPDEEAALAAFDEAGKTVTDFEAPGAPPVADDDSKPVTVETVQAEAGIDPNAPAKDPAAEAAAAAPAGDGTAAPDEETDKAAFLAKHKDKTPEELLELAFGQQKRAQRTAFDARQREAAAKTAAERATQVLEQTRRSIAERRAAFNDKLANDPDAATRDVFERQLTQEEQEAETLAHNTRIQQVDAFAASRIPDYETAKDAIFDYAVNEFELSPEELNSITDGKHLVILNLARFAGEAIKNGTMDMSGRILVTAPSPVADVVTDPRLKGTGAEPITTLGSAAARSANAGLTPEQELEALANLSEAELAKVPEHEFKRIMKAAGQA